MRWSDDMMMMMKNIHYPNLSIVKLPTVFVFKINALFAPVLPWEMLLYHGPPASMVGRNCTGDDIAFSQLFAQLLMVMVCNKSIM